MPHVQTTGFKPMFPSPGGEDSHRSLRVVQRTLRDGIADALDLNAQGRGMQGLAAAIRDKLSGAGPDAVPSMLETIDRALDDAAGKLAAQGVSQEQIDAGVARFRSRLAREIDALTGGDSAPKPATDVNKTAIAARQEVRERFSMDILTAEGDRVSIRFKSTNITEVAAAQVSRDGATSTAVEANVISRGRFKLEVDGNLNEAEKAAIGGLLEKVDGIAADFFGGDVEAAFAAASRVGLESDALTAFDVRMSYSKKTAMAAYTSNAKLGDAPAAAPVKTPATTPAPAAPVKAPEAVQSPVSAAVAATPVEPVTTPGSEPAADAAVPVATSAAVAHNTVASKSAIETITKFAKDVLERLDEANESDAAKFSLRWKVEFMMKAFGSVALTPAEQAAADALGVTLNAPKPGLI